MARTAWPFKFAARSKRLARKVIHVLIGPQRNARIAAQQIFREIELPFVAGDAVQLDERQFHFRMAGHQWLF